MHIRFVRNLAVENLKEKKIKNIFFNFDLVKNISAAFFL